MRNFVGKGFSRLILVAIATIALGASALIAAPQKVRISGISPSSGPIGTTVNLTGSGFGSSARVFFAAPAGGAVMAPVISASSNTLTVTVPQGAVSGSVYVQITSKSNSAQFQVENNTPANQPPTVSAGPSQSVTLPAGMTLTGSASDDGLPNGTLNATWSQVSGPGTTSFAQADSLGTTATFSAAGTYVLRLTATDGSLQSTSDMTATINAAAATNPTPTNQAPVVNAGANQAVTLPAGITLSGSATDDGLPTGSKLSVAWSQVSGPGAASFGTPQSLTSSASFSAAGTYVLRLTASDSQLSTTSDTTITVSNQTQSSGPVSSHGTTPGAINLMSTFQAISVKAPFSGDDNGNNTALVQYRKTGSSSWLDAYKPLIDRRATLGGVVNAYVNQARVSIVGLTPNTQYDVQVTWNDPDGTASQPAATSVWTLSYAVPTGSTTITVSDNASLSAALSSVNPGQTIHLNAGSYAPFTITRSGTAAAWINIEGDAAGGTIVSGAGVNQNVRIEANFVVVQRLTLSDSDSHGIFLASGVNHVFVQDNTVQNVSAKCALDPNGHYGDGGITVIGNNDSIVILRNTVKSTALNSAACTLSPIYSSPGSGIQWNSMTTTLVVQENTVVGGFRDAITADSSVIVTENVDIVGNTVSGYKDDGTESKGTNINVRMWGNKILADQGDTCVAGNTNTTNNVFGPLYIFRNSCRVTTANPTGTTVFKLGGAPTFVFHNTVDASTAVSRWDGFVGVTDTVVAVNNILKTAGCAIDYGAHGSQFDYNLYQITSGASFAYLWSTLSYDTLSLFKAGTGQELHGKQMDPLFADSEMRINGTSPAFDSGTVLPNFNDMNSAWPYSGAAPDMGVYEYWPK